MSETVNASQLDQQIELTRKIIATDGYEMSIGEVMNLYKDGELVIRPEYQRLFRWKTRNKSRFIESLLLGIPIPPIFVSQAPGGTWELIDGLQRVSTVLQFSGLLADDIVSDSQKVRQDDEDDDDDEGNSEADEESTTHSREPARMEAPEIPFCLEGTNFLPALAGKAWEGDSAKGIESIGRSAQILIKRARLRVEILKHQSDPTAKYELFQRLNTGGAPLTEQEVRNCIGVSINPSFQHWLEEMSKEQDFVVTTALTKNKIERQLGVELVLRFFAFTRLTYEPGLDVHEFLDKALLQMAGDQTFDKNAESMKFKEVFRILNTSLGAGAFKRWSGEKFSGTFLHSLYEILATGTAKQIDALKARPPKELAEFLAERSKELWSNTDFRKNSGMGIRGTTRLSKLLPMAGEYLKP